MTPAAPSLQRTEVLRRRIRIVVAITIAWNVIEAVIALLAGGAASSAALIGFGLDSVVEVLSAAAVAWQFASPRPELREKLALRVIAVSFFGLAAYVTVDALLSLTGLREPGHSPVGIGLAALSLIVMPFLSWFERRTGRELGSASAVADSKQTLICTYLSAALLAGLLLNSLFGWAWADSAAALVIAAFAIREGIEAWRGDACCAAPVAVFAGDGMPIACTLTPEAGKGQIESWRAFDDDYALAIDRTDTQITVHYAKVDDSVRRLRQLVAVESRCCSFVTWAIEESHAGLRLTVTGTRDELAALTVAQDVSPRPGRGGSSA